ncbi:hypothetical protein L7F22_026170, partial [Adiantum nelumboides]|nr:hypothetical protein [Adiantum nelumboides]
MECLHEDVSNKVEVDGPTTYADVVAYARGRTKKRLKKRQASQGILSTVVSRSIEVVAVRTQPPVIQSLPVVQEEPRVLWLQRDEAISMPKMPTKEVQVMEEPFKSMDKVEDTQACSGMDHQVSLGFAQGQRVRFADKAEEIPDLETNEEMEEDSSSSMDTDTSWETKSSYSRAKHPKLNASELSGLRRPHVWEHRSGLEPPSLTL